MNKVKKSLIISLSLICISSLNAQNDYIEIINKFEVNFQQEQDSIELAGMIDTAETGLASMQFKLGHMYRTGERPDGRFIQVAYQTIIFDYFSNSFQIDYDEAFYWLLESANQGYSDAENDLGIMYDYGEGIPENPDSAFILYKRAAEKQHFSAQNNIARLYYFGRGVEQDYLRSYTWASIAAENGSEMAAIGLNKLEELLSEEEVIKANRVKVEILNELY